MNDINIVKTTFVVYRFLDKLANATDKKINSRAVNSFYVTTKKPFENGVWEVSEDIIKLMEQKISLINLKILIEKVLHTLPSKFARFLIMRFIDGHQSDFIMQRLQISERSLARISLQSLELASKHMKTYGFDEYKLFGILMSEKWLTGVYNTISTKHLSKDYFSSLSFGGVVK